MSTVLHHGDCLDVMRGMEPDSVDAVVTDPPAGIGFMSAKWDHNRGGRTQWIAWMTLVMAEALRVAKPGAHAVVWALPRTSHWTMTAMEDAGWECRDVISHIFATGFPKNHSALKPAAEFWILARKPLVGTVAANVLRFGTGALNIDGCRIGLPADKRAAGTRTYAPGTLAGNTNGAGSLQAAPHDGLGRWPANVVLSHNPECVETGTRKVKADKREGGAGSRGGGFMDIGSPAGDGAPVGRLYGDSDGMETVSAWDCAPMCAVRLLDEQSGQLTSGTFNGQRTKDKFRTAYGDFKGTPEAEGSYQANCGGASRFFYTAKADSAQRNVNQATRNSHPTVKPLDLMAYLCRLVTPPGGTILDPFAGSGTTLIAAQGNGFHSIGIEQSAEYVAIAEQRIGLETATRLGERRERRDE